MSCPNMFTEFRRYTGQSRVQDGAGGARGPAVKKLERGKACRGVGVVVVGEFEEVDEFVPTTF